MNNDLIRCTKCGRETNQYAPYCEHCFEPFPARSAESKEVVKEKDAGPGMSDSSISDHGKELCESLKDGSDLMKKCPFCAESIRADAIKCRFCGEKIRKHRSGKKPDRKIVRYYLAALGLMFIMIVGYMAFRGFAGVKDLANGLTGSKNGTGLSDELRKDPAKADYVKNFVSLIGVGTLEEVKEKTGVPVKYLYGTIKNSGSKLIIRLQITVSYYNASGQYITEESIWAVSGSKGKPDSVKPGSSKEFQVPINTQPPGWSGKIKERISDIELLE